MSASRRCISTLTGLALGAAGCGAEPVTLELSFPDELVEAPARAVEVAVVEGAACGELLRVRHDELEQVGSVRGRTRTGYPAPPELDILDEAPRGRALAVDVAVQDAAGLGISRACRAVTLSSDAPTVVSIELHGLPDCPEEPTDLDLAIVLDTSTGMRNADIGLGNSLIDELSDFVQNMGIDGGTVRFSLVAHGHVSAKELVPATEDRQVVLRQLEALRGVQMGIAEHYAGLRVGAAHLKDRAVCGRRPAVLWVGGGPDQSSATTAQIATIEVTGTRGEPFDDIYVHGVGVSDPAVSAMRVLVDRVDSAQVEGALTEDRLRNALFSAGIDLKGLIPPPP